MKTEPDPSGVLSLPQATPGAIQTEAPPENQAAPLDPGTALDQSGVPFDPAKHEIDKVTNSGRLSKFGRWMLRRGNGARAAAGKPLAGATSNLVIPPTAAAPAAPGATPAAGAAQPNGVPLPSGPVAVSLTPPDAPPPLTLEAYESTAVGLANGLWACAQLWGGPKWEPSTDEVSAWSKAFQRVWHHYQLPIVGPLVELIILAFRAAAKRTDSQAVQGLFARAWRWSRGGSFNDPAPRADKAA